MNGSAYAKKKNPPTQTRKITNKIPSKQCENFTADGRGWPITVHRVQKRPNKVFQYLGGLLFLHEKKKGEQDETVMEMVI